MVKYKKVDVLPEKGWKRETGGWYPCVTQKVGGCADCGDKRVWERKRGRNGEILDKMWWFWKE